jgi:hypothetical protein
MSSYKYLIIGFILGMAVGAFVLYSFAQFSQISTLQDQINQLQSENEQLKANQVSPTPTNNQPAPTQNSDIYTGSIGKAI